MSIKMQEADAGHVLEVHVSGKLTKEDYVTFVPEVDRMIGQHGKISMLFEMHDFHGWQASALWEDTKFAVKHFSDIERLAVIGEKKWQKGMAIFCRPFTKAQVRYFDHDHEADAHAWLQSSATT